MTLVRWWTPGCPECAASAPALARLGARAPLVTVVRGRPSREIPGILAVDPEGAVLDRWAPPGSRESTMLTFLLDAHGRVRYVHPGGLLGEEDEHHLAQRIDALLAEKN